MLDLMASRRIEGLQVYMERKVLVASLRFLWSPEISMPSCWDSLLVYAEKFFLVVGLHEGFTV